MKKKTRATMKKGKKPRKAGKKPGKKAVKKREGKYAPKRKRLRVSVILPAFNEADRLEHAVDMVSKELEPTKWDYEIIIAEDGTTDGTAKVAARLQLKRPYVFHMHSAKRLGRGKALTNAIQSATGDVVVFMDVDLATDLKHLHDLIRAVAEEGYDYATGSRWMSGSDVERTADRSIASKGYNTMVHLFHRSKVKDHQCGFKAFRKKSVAQVLPEVKDEMWFWDTEVFLRGQRKGHKIKEIPVKWRADGRTKVKYVRDVSDMGSKIVKLWLEFVQEDVKGAFWFK